MSTETEETLDAAGSGTDLRFPTSVLILGGALLVVMGQVIQADVSETLRGLVYLIMAVGLAAFGIASLTISRGQPPGVLSRIGGRLAGFFGISPGQLVLLFMAPWYSMMAALSAGDQLQATHPTISLAAWFIAIGAVLTGSYRRNDKSKDLLDRKEVLLIIALFLVAFTLRAVAIGSLPPTLSGDEGAAGLTSVEFASGEANNLFTVGWFSFPSFYFALQSLGILAFDQTATALRISSAFGGALTVVGLYWLARILFGRWTAILAAVFLSVHHYHIHFSRIGLNNIWDGFFAVLVMASLAHGWKTGRRSSFLICGLALGFGQYFYVSIRLFPLLLLLWAGVALVVDRTTFKQRFADLVLVTLVAFVVALPLLFFYQQHPSEFNAPFQRVTIFEGWLEQTAALQGKSELRVIWDQLANTALGITTLPLRHWYNPGSPLLLPLASALFLLGLLWALLNLNLSRLLVVLGLLVVIILGGLSQEAPTSQRFIIAAPLAAMLTVLPLSALTRWMQREWPRYRMLVVALAILIMTWIVINDLRYYFVDVYDSYVLGGPNTEVATEIAHYLDEQNPPPDVYFFGFPRMGYYSLSTIPYLVPEVEAVDVLEPLTSPPDWALDKATIFLFLPEREDELAHVQASFPRGTYQMITREDGALLFVAYVVS